jgi:hypothetical protein
LIYLQDLKKGLRHLNLDIHKEKNQDFIVLL